MNRLPLLIAGFAVLISQSAFSDIATAPVITMDQIDTLSTLPVQSRIQKSPLKWKIGDTLNYALIVKGLPVGSLTTKFISRTQTEYNIQQTFSMFGKQMEIQISYDKSTGEVTSYNVAGVPIPVEMGVPQVANENEEFVTVGAGAFNCTHYLGKTKAGLKTETWVNTKDLPLNGTVKIITFIKDVEVSFELMSYAD